MTSLQDLIETAQTLSKRLEMAAYEETKFCTDIQLKLEQLSWEMMRTANELKSINYYNLYG